MARRIGDVVRRRREELGLSLAQVGLRSRGGVDASQLSRLERGKAQPSAEFLMALAPVLDVQLEYLYKLAGYLPADRKVRQPEPVSLEAVVRAHPKWSNETKETVIRIIRLADATLSEDGEEVGGRTA